MKVACSSCQALFEAGDTDKARSGPPLCDACRAARGAEGVADIDIDMPVEGDAAKGAARQPMKRTATLPFFQVEQEPAEEPAPRAKEAKKKKGDEAPPDSGMADLAAIAKESAARVKERRIDAALVNLSGGLFSNVSPNNQPLQPLPLPSIDPLAAPPPPPPPPAPSEPAQARPSIAPVLPVAAEPTRAAPKASPAPPARLIDRQGARVGILAAVIAACSLVVWGAFKSKGVSAEATADATSALAAPEQTAAAVAALPAAIAAPTETSAAPVAAPPAATASAASAASAESEKPSEKATAKSSAQEPRAGAAAAGPAKSERAGAAKPSKNEQPAAAAPPPPSGGEFNKAAARSALASAAARARGCKKPGDPSGGARVSVTFAPSGRVTAARVNGPPFQGTATGGCIAAAFRGISVPPFGGSPVAVSKEVSIR